MTVGRWQVFLWPLIETCGECHRRGLARPEWYVHHGERDGYIFDRVVRIGYLEIRRFAPPYAAP